MVKISVQKYLGKNLVAITRYKATSDQDICSELYLKKSLDAITLVDNIIQYTVYVL